MFRSGRRAFLGEKGLTMRTAQEVSSGRPLFESLEPRQLLAVILQEGFEGTLVPIWNVGITAGATSQAEWELNDATPPGPHTGAGRLQQRSGR